MGGVAAGASASAVLQVPNLADAAREAQAIWKFALSHPDTRALQQFADNVEQTLGLACEWSWHDQVDIARAGNSKGKRLAEWVESQGMTMKDVLAFGDNYNDLSMLENVGWRGDGQRRRSDQSARARVIGTNTEPGIAETIRREVL